MSRTRITKPATLTRLSKTIGQPVVVALARGNTNHRIDCVLPDHRIVSLYADGTFEHTEYTAAESVMPHRETSNS